MSQLVVEPSALQFPLTLNKEVVQLLFVSNRSSRRTVTFKVKTTSPRRYSVRPTRGILWPGDQEQITITLRALRKPPSDADDCRDRFKALSLPEPCPASSLTLAPTLTLTLAHPSSLTVPRAFKVLSLPLEHGQAAQLREVAHEQRRVLLDGLWGSEEALAQASVRKVHCSFESPSPSSFSPIPEEHAAQARWIASRPGSRDSVFEPSSPALAQQLLSRGDSSCSCIEEQSTREDEGGLAAPVALRARENGGAGVFVQTLRERGLGLRQRQGWIVDPSYG